MDKLLNNQYKTFKDGALVKSKVHHMYIQLNLSKLPLSNFSVLFHSEWKFIIYFLIMYIYCVYPAITKSPKQLTNCLKKEQK
jgi:hypothetical protein